MEPTEQDLRQRYDSMTTEELVDLYREAELTELASLVLNQALESRGVSAKDFRALVAGEDVKEADSVITHASTPLPNLWIGYFIALVFFAYGLGEFFIDPSVEDRVSPGLVVISLVGLVYWLFCVHRLHWVLAEATNSTYPVSPGKGAGFNLIPFFNLYWIFKWPNEIAEYLNRQSGERTMSKGWPGFFILLGSLIGRLDGSIGLVIIFTVLVYVSRKVRRVVEFNA